MATIINQRGGEGSDNVRKPQLLRRLEGHLEEINAAVILRNEDGVVSVSDDK